MKKAPTYYSSAPLYRQAVGTSTPAPIVASFIEAARPHIRPVFEKSYDLAEWDAGLDSRPCVSKILVPSPALTWDETRSLTSECFGAFGGEMARIVEGCLKSPERLVVRQAAAGRGTGSCYSQTREKPYPYIEMAFDRTVSGPVYLAHELGHYAANILYGFKYGRDGMTIRARRNLAEPQAFFLQHVMYDFLATRPAYACAASTHRVAEGTRALYRIANGVLAGAMRDHVVSAAERRDIMEGFYGPSWSLRRQADSPDYLEWLHDRASDSLHGHGMGMLIGTGLYATAKEQGRLTEVAEILYEPESLDGIGDVLRKTGMGRGSDFRDFAGRAVGFIADTLDGHEAQFGPRRETRPLAKQDNRPNLG